MENNIEANSPAQVLVFINEKGMRPISIKLLKGTGLIEKLGLSYKKISSEDKIFLTKYLGLMLKVGTGLMQAIEILINDIEKPTLKSILLEIKSNLQKGNPFFITFAKYPQSFSPVFINMIRSGENSGKLEKTLEDLSASLEKETELKKKIISAMIYPLLLLTTSAFMFTALLVFAVPRITGIFASSTINPPLFTKAVMALSSFLIANGIVLLIIFLALTLFFVLFYKKSKTGKIFIQRMFQKMPLIKTIIFKRAIQRLCVNLSDLLSSGLPLIEAIELSSETAGHPDIQSSLQRIARESLTQGLSMGEAFKREAIFPQVLVNLINISEKTGHTADLLKTLGSFYTSEIDSSIKTAMSFFEPAMLLFIAIFVGGVALSVIVPIYQMIGQF